MGYIEGQVYCTAAGHWVDKEDAIRGKNGVLLCPRHGKRVRTAPRCYGKSKKPYNLKNNNKKA